MEIDLGCGECDKCEYQTGNVGEDTATAFISNHLEAEHTPAPSLYTQPSHQGGTVEVECYKCEYKTGDVGEATAAAFIAHHLASEQSLKSAPAGQLEVRMERYSVPTVCSGCNQQVETSVTSSFNMDAYCWCAYSVFCGLIAFCACCLLFFMDHFTTWKHTCPKCAKVLEEYCPKANRKHKIILGVLMLLNIVVLALVIIVLLLCRTFDPEKSCFWPAPAKPTVAAAL